MNYSKTAAIIMLACFVLLLALFGSAALVTMTGDSFTATRGLANAPNALGSFDGTLATFTPRGGDTATWTLSNPSFTGTVIDVRFELRMRTTAGAFSNDDLTIQYSNDSGTTWFNAAANVVPTGTLASYGNYTVTSSFLTITELNNAQVRVLYNQNAGPDNPTVGLDAVEMYVTYDPPPRVNLTFPLNATWRNTTTISFNYTPYSLVNYSNCSLFINGTLNTTNQTAIVNATNNTINVTGFTDGDYLWNVSCTDQSALSGTSTVAWIVRVDLTPPVVTSVSPQNNTESPAARNYFVFNITDAAAISSCALFINGAQSNSTTSPSKGVNVTLSSSMANGNYLWYVNCTDENGWTGQSEVRNITVWIPDIAPNSSSYFALDDAGLFGTNWAPGAHVTINITMSNGTNLTHNRTVNSSGMINATQQIGVDFPLGTYFVYAIQQNDSSRNATTSFAVRATPKLYGLATPGSVVLNAGATKEVLCNFTVSDLDGAADITGANATLYTSPSTHGSALSNLSKYENGSCTMTGSNATAKNFSCGVFLYYYALNGTWTCNATAISADATNSSSTTFPVDPLYALSVSDALLSFGGVVGGAQSPTVIENITNYGNQHINVSALGYGSALGDNNSFSCSTVNITVGAMRFAPNATAAYGEKEQLNSTFTSLRLSVSSQTNTTLIMNTSYWQVQVPDGNFDNEECNGTIIFQAGAG